jgi:hypothetical protein
MQLSRKSGWIQQHNRQPANQLQNKILLHCSWFFSRFGDLKSWLKNALRSWFSVQFIRPGRFLLQGSGSGLVPGEPGAGSSCQVSIGHGIPVDLILRHLQEIFKTVQPQQLFAQIQAVLP